MEKSKPSQTKQLKVQSSGQNSRSKERSSARHRKWAEQRRERRKRQSQLKGHPPGRRGNPPYFEKEEEAQLIEWLNKQLNAGINPSSARVEHRV